MHRLLEDPALAPYEPIVGRAALREAIDAELSNVRASGAVDAFGDIVARTARRLDADASRILRRTINATGTLLHTNLGRAPIAREAMEHALETACGYSNLEYDLEGGSRGSRYDRLGAVLRERTSAEDAVVVNNCAAAVLLVLDTFARDCEVIVARGQLVEIGGGFRIPDVLRRSGARLVEVGTTNKVRVEDYAGALTPQTTLLFRSHRSNFSISGFTEDVDAAGLCALGRRAGIPVVEDLGSGALIDLTQFGLPHERTVQDAVRDGVGLVAFSGDKLLGGPQAGIIVGRAPLVARLRSNPLLRALRIDKVTIALLDRTLRLYRDGESLRSIPFYRMLALSADALRGRAALVAAGVSNALVVDVRSQIGGGSLPAATIASVGVAVAAARPARAAEALRRRQVPILARIEGDAVVCDLRTVAPEDDAYLRDALLSIAA